MNDSDCSFFTYLWIKREQSLCLTLSTWCKQALIKQIHKANLPCILFQVYVVHVPYSLCQSIRHHKKSTTSQKLLNFSQKGGSRPWPSVELYTKWKMTLHFNSTILQYLVLVRTGMPNKIQWISLVSISVCAIMLRINGLTWCEWVISDLSTGCYMRMTLR